MVGRLGVGDLNGHVGDGGGEATLTHQRRDGGLDGVLEGVA